MPFITKVFPLSCTPSGNVSVTIVGHPLSAVSDVQAVQLAGVNATIVHQNVSMVVVQAGMSGGISAGPVIIYSASMGVATYMGFSYTPGTCAWECCMCGVCCV